MLTAYLVALLVGGGTLAAQLALGGHDAAGHDAGGHDGDGDHADAMTFLASVRFWAFALFAFGAVGTLITLFGFAGPAITASVAAAMGIVSGVVAVSVLRRLRSRTESSHAGARDAVGQVGRVLVPPNDSGHAKVRVRLKGAYVDYVAKTSEPLAEGDSVVVEDIDGDEVTVSRAPRELE